MWEVFERVDMRTRPNREPTCSWDKRGTIYFGQKVFEMLEQPATISLYVDRGRNLVGMKKSDAVFARPVHKQVGFNSYFIRACAFQGWCGVNIIKTLKAKAESEDGMVVFSINADS